VEQKPSKIEPVKEAKKIEVKKVEKRRDPPSSQTVRRES